jgi:hypothetical protein
MDNLNKNIKFEWLVSGNAPLLFPTELVMGNLLFEDLSKIDIPESIPFATAWGKPVSMHLLPEKYYPAPKYILMAWLSIVEGKFYAVADELPKEQIEALLAEKNEETKKPKYDTLIVGMAPYGNLAIWMSGNGITTQVAWLKGKEATVEMKDFAPNSKLTLEEYVKQALADSKEASDNFQKNGLPHSLLFEQYMQKFNYRITPKFENAQFEGIDIYYYNGELNTLNSGEHTANTMRAKPSKIVLHWSEGKKKYDGYFWTDENKLVETFKSCYGNDTLNEGELVIQVDPSHKKCRFLLQNNNTSVEIPTEDIQYIIFKNRFEFYRSKNYKKPKEGWRS